MRRVTNENFASPSLPLIPRPVNSELVLAPPGTEPGYWVGAPSALRHGEHIYLAYRLRGPIEAGRGWANVVARSSDGVHFETLSQVTKEEFACESLERPALAVTPEGRWRLYVSCATPDTKHWRVDVLEADDPASFTASTARTVLPGSDEVGVKDPVVRYTGSGGGQPSLAAEPDRAGPAWHLWASVHPLERWDDADRMTTEYATSTDGLEWTWQGTALAGRPGQWDSRGVRIASVHDTAGRRAALYDGRASAGENWEERTGFAWGSGGGQFRAVGEAPAASSPYAPYGLRYVDVVPLGAGQYRLYYEITRPDGAHELRTEQQSMPEGGQA